MNPQLTDPRWSITQQQFLSALETAGANKLAYAKPIDTMPPLSVRELQALVDAGVVREAAANGYYLYPRQVLTAEPLPTVRVPRPSGPRLIKALVFWIAILLIPILLIQFST